MAPPDYEEDVNDQDPEILLAKAEIARTRAAITTSMTALQRELSRAVDWRAWVAQRPLAAVMIAFGVGALLGLVGTRLSQRGD